MTRGKAKREIVIGHVYDFSMEGERKNSLSFFFSFEREEDRMREKEGRDRSSCRIIAAFFRGTREIFISKDGKVK